MFKLTHQVIILNVWLLILLMENSIISDCIVWKVGNYGGNISG